MLLSAKANQKEPYYMEFTTIYIKDSGKDKMRKMIKRLVFVRG